MLTSRINIGHFAWAGVLLLVYTIMFRGLQREEFLLYFSVYSTAFLLHLYPLSKWAATCKPVLFIVTGLLIRLMAVSAFPTLSEDIYRYIWDGYLTKAGISPYSFTPDECMALLSRQDHPILHSLYPLLNSASYHSVYPPAAQIFFTFGGWLAASCGISQAIIGLKALFLLVEFVGWFFVYQLFQIQKTDQKWMWALWLNPLLILEWNFSGHIESAAATFIVIGVFMIQMKKNYLSGMLLALAVLVKLWPLLFAPFFIKFIKTWKEQFNWISAFVLTGAIGSLPLLIQPEYFSHFKSSLDLYFRTFEFNASIYYLCRAIGGLWYGYNPIHLIGPLCTMLMLGICIWLYRTIKVLETKHLMVSILVCGIIYLIFATTVHPWYLTILLPFAYLNRSQSLVIWSFLIFTSYHAYRNLPVKEDMLLITTTYSLIAVALILDLKRLRKTY